MIYVNKIENKIKFEFLTPRTMKLHGTTKSKLTKDENGENMTHLEITEAVLIHCNIINNGFQQDSRVLYTFVPNKSFGQLITRCFTKKVCIFKNF